MTSAQMNEWILINHSERFLLSWDITPEHFLTVVEVRWSTSPLTSQPFIHVLLKTAVDLPNSKHM